MPSLISRFCESLKPPSPEIQRNEVEKKEIARLMSQGHHLEKKVNKMECHNAKCSGKFSIIQMFVPGEEEYKIAKVSQKIHGGKTTCSTVMKVEASSVDNLTTAELIPVSDDKTYVRCLLCSCQTEMWFRWKEVDGQKVFFLSNKTEQEQRSKSWRKK